VRGRRWVCRGIGLMFMAASPLPMLFPAPPAGADAPSGVAYWYRAAPSSALPAATPAPQVPKGGLYVVNDPTADPSADQALGPANQNGPSAYSGVRFDAPAGSTATLTLKIAQGSTTQASPVLAACPITGAWSPSANGGPSPYDLRPGYDCTTTVKGSLSTDGTSVSFSLTDAFAFVPGTFNVAIIPDPASQPAPPFSVAFEAPDSSSVLVAQPFDSSSSGSDVSPSAVAPESAVVPSVAPTVNSSAFAGSASSDLGGGATLASPPKTSAPTVNRPALPAGLPAAVHAPAVKDHRFERLIAVGLLFALGAAWWWVGGQTPRAPRLLGSLGGTGAAVVDDISAAAAATPATRLGGIGRFARPRLAAARRL
jgi:hypothetical protein